MTISVAIEKTFDKFHLSVNFQAENDVVAFLGESGCGKSLTLKCIAGIETPDKGRIVVNDRVLFDSEKKINVPVRERNIGYLFQNYALFPNMTVAQNIGISVPKKNWEKQVAIFVDSFKLNGLEKAYPRTLSGGQQQRVALARMLASSPELILLDEPFSALDEHLKWQLEQELMLLLEKYQRTTLFVSHNRNEVFRLSQQIGIINQGQLQGVGSKHGVFQAPKTKAAALLTGCKNISSVEKLEDSKWFCKDWQCELVIPSEYQIESFNHIGIRAHDLIIKKTSSADFVIQRVIESVFDYVYVIKSNKNSDLATVLHVEQPKTSGQLFQLGEEINLEFPLESLMFLTD